MESLRSLLDNLEKYVQCAICLQSLRNPVTTKCDHNFCNHCITEALRSKVQIPCPLCKKVVKTRSLKKASHLSCLVPLVHRVTNQVQEEAGIPYTLSQSTRKSPVQNQKSAASSTSPQNHQNGQGLSNGDVSLREDTVFIPPEQQEQTVIFGIAKEQSPEGRKDAVACSSKVSVNSAVGEDKQQEGSIKNHLGEKSDIDTQSSGNLNSHNIVTNMTVTADVHHSPPKGIESFGVTQTTAKESITSSKNLKTNTRKQRMPSIEKNVGKSPVYTGSSVSTLDASEIIEERIPQRETENPRVIQKTAKVSTVSKNPKMSAGAQKVRTPNLEQNPRKFFQNGSSVATFDDPEIVEDPYAFPISQNVAAVKKKVGKKPGRKPGAAALKKRKSSSDIEKGTKRRKRSPRPFSDAEIAVASKMIAEVEKHPLTIEKIPTTTVKGEKPLPQKSAPKQVASPQKSTSKPAEKPVKGLPNKKRKTNAESSNGQAKEHPQLTRRLLSESSSSSSSELEAHQTKRVLVRENSNQQSVKDKVSSWLQTASPSAVSDSGAHPSPSPNKSDRMEVMSDDDIISHSQVSVERLPGRVIILKRRKFSPIKLDSKIQESVKNLLWSRETAIFGASKPKRTFLPKIRKESSCLLLSTEPSKNIPEKPKKATRQRGSKAQKTIIIGDLERKKNTAKRSKAKNDGIFGVPGLLQDESPFGTPEETLNENQVSPKNVTEPNTSKKQSSTHEKNQPVEKLVELPVKDSAVAETTSQEVQPVVGGTQGLGEFEDKSQKQNKLKNVVDELPTPGTENYEIQDPDTEYVLKVVQSPVVDPSEIHVAEGAKSPPSEVTDKLQQSAKFVLSPSKKMKNSSLPPKKRSLRSTPTRASRNGKLPLLGDSPTTFASPKQSQPRRPAPAPTVPGIELGLLDFSEAMSMPSAGDDKNTDGARPEAVAKTCRMVMESLDELKKSQETPDEANDIPAPVEESDQDDGTEDSVVPPSTSTVNLDIPPTRQKCDLEKMPLEIKDSEHEDGEGSMQDKQKEGKERTPNKEKVISNTNIIRNAPLPGESEYSEVEKNIAEPVALDSVMESTNVSDDEEAGSLRCLSNGWGGTKLRIFRSTASDTDSNLSGFSAKKKRGRKSKEQTSQESFASHKQESASFTIKNASGSKPATEKTIIEAEKTSSEPSAVVIPSSENGAEAITANTIRKSARWNKGYHTSFEYNMVPFVRPYKKKLVTRSQSTVSATPDEVPEVEESVSKQKKGAQNITNEYTESVAPAEVPHVAAESDSKPKKGAKNSTTRSTESAATAEISHATTDSVSKLKKGVKNATTRSAESAATAEVPHVTTDSVSKLKKGAKNIATQSTESATTVEFPHAATESVLKPKKSAKNKPKGNLVLKHLRNAIAEVDDWRESLGGDNIDKPLGRKVSEPKKASKSTGKLTKIHPTKKMTVGSKKRLQTGKRTKQNKAILDRKVVSEDDAYMAHTSSDENKMMNLSWPLEDSNTQNRFFCSQPTELPKHITDVSVRVIKLNEISTGNFVPEIQRNDIDDEVDSSPMLFSTQDGNGKDLERQEPSKKQRGRSISIDLTNSQDEWTNRPTVIEKKDSTQNDVDFAEDDADDVICCSWNEEEKMENVAPSCHEDESSVASGQHLNQQNTPKQQAGEKEDHQDRNSIEMNDITEPEVISSLRNVKSSIEKQFPQNTEVLNQAVDLCNEIVSAIKKGISDGKVMQVGPQSVVKAPETAPKILDASIVQEPRMADKIPVVDSPVKRKRGRRAKKKAAEVEKNIEISKKKPQMATKKDPSPGEVPSTSGLRFKTRFTRQQEAAEKQEVEQQKRGTDTADELADYFNEIDDMPLFDDPMEVIEADTCEVTDQPGARSQKEQSVTGDISASVEDAMAALQSELDATAVEKNPEDASEHLDFTEETHAGDVIEATQDSQQKNDQAEESADVIASNVDAWLKRLSDLNRRKGEIQKQKIGEMWSKSSPSSSGSPSKTKAYKTVNGESEPVKQTENILADNVSKEKGIGENLHGVASEANVPNPEADTEREETNISIQKNELTSPKNTYPQKEPTRTVSPSKSYPRITPDQLPQLSVVIRRTPIKEIQERIMSPARSNESTCRKILTELNKTVDEPVAVIRNPDVLEGGVHDKKANVEEWLESSEPAMMSPAREDSPIPEKLGFVTTGLQEKDVKLVKIFANRYSGQFYPTFNVARVTHVIVRATPQRSCDRTLKYLQGIAGKKWVVDIHWVVNSLSAGKKLPEDDYEVKGDNCMKELELEGCDVPQGPIRSRTSDPEYQHLKGFRAVCLPPYSLITTEQTSELLRMCGATVVSHLGELINNDVNKAAKPKQRLIIVDVEMNSNNPDYTAMGEQFGAAVVNIEWVYESISRFEAQHLDDFKITGFTQDSELHSFGL